MRQHLPIIRWPYYCYETNNPRRKRLILKVNDIVIAFPNAKVLKRHDYEPKEIMVHWKEGRSSFTLL